jgi:hypothetical protein
MKNLLKDSIQSANVMYEDQLQELGLKDIEVREVKGRDSEEILKQMYIWKIESEYAGMRIVTYKNQYGRRNYLIQKIDLQILIEELDNWISSLASQPGSTSESRRRGFFLVGLKAVGIPLLCTSADGEVRYYGMYQQEGNVAKRGAASWEFIKEWIARRGSNGKSRWTHYFGKEISSRWEVMKYKRRYKSPFGLLQNIGEFEVDLGGWNSYMEAYGIKVRGGEDEEISPSETGSTGPNTYKAVPRYAVLSEGNMYLQKQYEQLWEYRESGRGEDYWRKAIWMMKYSAFYHVATLNQWYPGWYNDPEKSLKSWRKTFLKAGEILAKNKGQPTLKRVWIDDGDGRKRALSVPSLPWRFVLRMWADMLVFWIEPILSPETYHGFIYGRGTKTWWEHVVSGSLLDKSAWIYEFDLASYFHQISRKIVYLALVEEGRTPKGVAAYIMTLLDNKVEDASGEELSAEAKLEDSVNRAWKETGQRGLAMGLSLSPILAVLVMHRVFNRLGILGRGTGVELVAYADDASLFFRRVDFKTHGLDKLRELRDKYAPWLKDILTDPTQLFNAIPEFRTAGVIMSGAKSSWVKKFGKWLKDYKALGLQYTGLSDKEAPTLQGATKGRPPSELDPKGRAPSTLKLDWDLQIDSGEELGMAVKALIDAKRFFNLNLDRLISEQPGMFGTVMARLYTGSKNLDIVQNFRLNPEEKSFLKTLFGGKDAESRRRWMYKRLKIDTFTASTICNHELLWILTRDPMKALGSKYADLKKELKHRGAENLIEEKGVTKTQKILESMGSWNYLVLQRPNEDEQKGYESVDQFFNGHFSYDPSTKGPLSTQIDLGLFSVEEREVVDQWLRGQDYHKAREVQHLVGLEISPNLMHNLNTKAEFDFWLNSSDRNVYNTFYLYSQELIKAGEEVPMDKGPFIGIDELAQVRFIDEMCVLREQMEQKEKERRTGETEG